MDNDDLRKILDRQNTLIEDNNRLLHKLYRFEMINFWSKAVWMILLIGLPFALYYYVLEPYFTALGSSYDTFSAGINEIPGIKHLNEWISSSSQNVR